LARTKHKNGNGKDPGGRPSLYNPAVHPLVAKQCARHFGDTHKELSKALEISTATLIVWKREHPELKAAINEGVMEYDCGPITNALRECCLGDEWDEVKREFIELEINGQVVRCTERKVHINDDGIIVSGLLPGDVLINGKREEENPLYIYNNNNRAKNPSSNKKAKKGKSSDTKIKTKLTATTVLVKGEKVSITHKKKHPDPTSIFFWLQNRKSDLWKNVQRQVVESTSTVNHRHEHVVKAAKQLPRKEIERFRNLLHSTTSSN
jgi:hypothetical protein